MIRRPRLTPRFMGPAVALLLLTMAAAMGLMTGKASAHTTASEPGFRPRCTQLERFRARNFPERPKIQNTYLPLIPGMRSSFEGTVDDVPHRVDFIVTDLTKRVDGVNVLVVWDTDTSEDQVVESELSFWAQDKEGNVWNLGEYAEEYEYDDEGELIGVSASNTWISGRRGAKAGIHMVDDPEVSRRQYIQGFAPRIDFLDCAKVVEKTRNQEVCVETGCYGSVVVTNETNLAVPDDGIQSKYHAPGKGIVKIGAVDPPTGEVLELVERKRIRGTPEWQEALEAAQELDERAYDLGREGGYRATSPAERLPFKG